MALRGCGMAHSACGCGDPLGGRLVDATRVKMPMLPSYLQACCLMGCALA